MLLTNTETIPGYRVTQLLGLVRGNTIRSKHIGRDIMAGLYVGGELKGYTEMMTEACNQATQRMIDEASALGANAVLNVRYTTSMMMQGSAEILEILAYGTAVVVEAERD